jgi:outer membrane protein OmpA-like peptidoglycan-associated protein/tetratricopeptide (TPR) repeat protein
MKYIIKKHIAITVLLFAIALIDTASLGMSAYAANPNRAKYRTMLNKAYYAYDNMDYAVAASYYEKYLDATGNKTSEIMNLLGESYLNMKNYNKAYDIYKNLYNTKGIIYRNTLHKLSVSDLFARKEDYAKAATIIKSLPAFADKIKGYQNANLYEMKKDSARWSVNELNISTTYREFSPFIYLNKLYFSSNRPIQKKVKAYAWDGNNYSRLWVVDIDYVVESGSPFKTDDNEALGKISQKLAGVFEKADVAPSKKAVKYSLDIPKVNSGRLVNGTNLVEGLEKNKFNAGGIAIDAFGGFYYCTNKNESKDGTYRLVLMEAKIDNGKVTKAKELALGDATSYSVMHPAINADGTILVFASDKPGGVGGLDLYYAVRDGAEGQWSEVSRFKTQINTAGNDVFPYISTDGYMYFSSNGLSGLGGLDIYRTKLEDAMYGNSVVEHLSYPINSTADDFGLTMNESANGGYFTSDRNKSDDDIYSFTINTQNIRKAEPERAVVTSLNQAYAEGYVYNEEDNSPVENATVFMYDPKTNTILTDKTNQNGRYRFPVDDSGEKVIKVVKPQHTNMCKNVYINSKQGSITPIREDFKISRLKEGQILRYDNIHFSFDKAIIREDAKPILDGIVDMLNKYPVKIELGSYTDSRGSDDYNLKLSERRSQAVVDYLVSRGIDRSRLIAKGYGETNPLNSCVDGVLCNTAQYQANRRTEIKVLNYDSSTANDVFKKLDKVQPGQTLNVSDFPAGFFNTCK